MCICICISAQFSWNTSMYLIHWLQFCISPVLWKLTTYISEGTGNIFSAMHAGNAPENIDQWRVQMVFDFQVPKRFYLQNSRQWNGTPAKRFRAESYISAARNLSSITRWRVVLTQISWECAIHPSDHVIL